MNDKLNRDAIGWDFVNWSQSLDFFNKHLDYKKINKILELGSGEQSGGYSLFFANKKLNVVCSSVRSPSNKLKGIHQKYKCNNYIKYESVDAKNISINAEFDLICFKSMLGGICRDNNKQNAKVVFKEIFKALKPNGYLVFSENIRSTWFHLFLRKIFGDYYKWHFFSINELIELIEKNYEIVDYSTTGFLGCFGRNEWQKNILGYLDKNIINYLIPKEWNYIFFGVFKKSK